jgi:hypothetical protein
MSISKGTALVFSWEQRTKERKQNKTTPAGYCNLVEDVPKDHTVPAGPSVDDCFLLVSA